MPRYRFRWENHAPSILHALCGGEALEGRSPAEALRAWYGARPTADFVAENWPVLRDEWLGACPGERTEVVRQLRDYRLGDMSIDVGADGELAYLRSCRNQITLRDIVLDAFIIAGESAVLAVKPSATASGSTWDHFGESLAASLAALDEHQYLIVSVKGTGVEQDQQHRGASHYVQFAAQGQEGLRAEAVSNHFLAGSERLAPEREAALAGLGWCAPTHGPKDDEAVQVPHGSVNHYRDYGAPVPFSEVAQLACDTLTTVFGVARPGFLQYSAFAADGTMILLPGLGLAREPDAYEVKEDAVEARMPIAPQSPDELRELLTATIRAITGKDEIITDDDGDIPITFGSTVLFVRVMQDMPLIRVIAPVLVDVASSPALFEALSDLNRDYRFISSFWADDTVLVTVDVWANPYIESQVLWMLEQLGKAADEIDDELSRKFGGRVFLGTEVQRRTVQETGGYL